MPDGWDGFPPNAGEGGFYFIRTRRGRTEEITVGQWLPDQESKDGGLWRVLGIGVRVRPAWMLQMRAEMIRQIFPEKNWL